MQKTTLKPLPTDVTKQELKYMYPNISKADLYDTANDAIASLRLEPSKRKKSLTVAEFVYVLMRYKIPSGYTNVFKDGQTLDEKIKMFKI